MDQSLGPKRRDWELNHAYLTNPLRRQLIFITFREALKCQGHAFLDQPADSNSLQIWVVYELLLL